MRTAGWEVLASGWCPAPPQCTPGHLVVPGLLVVMEEVLAEELDDEEQLVRRHRKEKKELQAKIQGMKNAVPKNDKKRRKQLTEEVAKLEKEMEQKHREELEHLKLASKENKEKKAALEKEREERIAEAETENLSGARCREAEKLAQILAARELEIKQIPSDGHCMYRALEDQLRDQDCALTVPALRKQTADYMQSHAEDFLPFLTNPSTGDMYTPEEFGKYCEDIVNTAAWGGQLELRALSHILQTPIEILQADSPPIIVGEEYPKNPLILVYMRHAYGLGEHYNSVTRLVNSATENCS
ncbi:deubiquitinase OTUD6B isoform X5 [Nannospalax galili]|uniref:deubiquitinase OTUD6B isoform X5 n=1 Tax=Nannospalax galili TaxID=1026970 RepID=UPI00111BECB0|nr:deubiquitinase OTUD6B isoform X5 [Nannospalax galili]